MALTTNKNYNPVGQDVQALVDIDAEVLGALGGIGFFFFFVFVVGSIFFAQYCAQVFANEVHHDVYWYPQLAAFLALIGFVCQVVLVQIPFRMKFLGPISRRYREQGYHLTATVWKRVREVQGKTTLYSVVVVYAINETTFYSKKIGSLTEREFMNTEFVNLVLLPGIPTSAIRKKTYRDITGSLCESASAGVRMIASPVSPIAWFLAFYYANTMTAYSPDDTWTKWGLWMLFVTCLISSICLAYWLTVTTAKSWLNGDACVFELSSLPYGFAQEVLQHSGDSARGESTGLTQETHQYSGDSTLAESTERAMVLESTVEIV